MLAAVYVAAGDKPAISEIDRIRIAEVFRIGEKLQNELWPEWSTAPFSLLFITDDSEFLIRHPKPNDEFTSIGYDKLLKSEVFVRPRKFQKGLLATFPAFNAAPVIVIGKAENTTDKTSSRWVFVALHEHFHQLQYSQPDYYSEVNALDLAKGDTSGMWQINYPFPYKKSDIARSFRELSTLLLDAYQAADQVDRERKLQTYLQARKEFADSLSADDRRYASFQLWQEGIARYTQYRMADLAARKIKPSKKFRALKDFTPFEAEAERILKITTDELRQLDLTTWERTVFYPFGAIEGLLLDRVNPQWRSKYFTDKFAIEKFYPVFQLTGYGDRKRSAGFYAE
jgi:hypothetical protein